MGRAVKQAVSLAIEEGGWLLIVQRPADDEDLPDAWGLPAASLHAGESWRDAALRAGREKLGVGLEVGRERKRGLLARAAYDLEMRLFDARIIDGVPVVPQREPAVTQYQAWRWGQPADLEAAARKGSLCCRLYLPDRVSDFGSDPI